MSDFKGVKDTLYIPLTARIYVSKEFPEYFYDEKSLELEKHLPNSTIEKKSSQYSMIASVARYYNLDQMITNFIEKNGKCNIINLGAGLETSYWRINRKNALFYEMDMEDVIDLRRKILGENENEYLISGDLFKMDWINEIDTSLPSLLIVSGVFQYYHEDEIIGFIQDAKSRLKNAELIFDATDESGIRYTNRYVKKTGNASALMYFYVNNSQEFASKSNTKLIEERVFYSDARRLLSKKLGIYTRIAMRVADWKKQAIIVHLKL